MVFYVINRDRLQREYDHHLKSGAKGSFNWFVNPDNVLHILIDLFNVTYVYMTPVDHIDPILRIMLDKHKMIEGFVTEQGAPRNNVQTDTTVTLQEATVLPPEEQ